MQVRARAVAHIHTDEGAQGAVGSVGARVEGDTAHRAEAAHVRAQRHRIRVLVRGLGEARDAQAGVGARDVEEAGTIGGADPHVFHGNGLLYGKIRGLCPGNRGETGGRPEEKALYELHFSPPKFRDPGGPGVAASRTSS
jgi:hypothetical protein